MNKFREKMEYDKEQELIKLEYEHEQKAIKDKQKKRRIVVVASFICCLAIIIMSAMAIKWTVNYSAVKELQEQQEELQQQLEEAQAIINGIDTVFYNTTSSGYKFVIIKDGAISRGNKLGMSNYHYTTDYSVLNIDDHKISILTDSNGHEISFNLLENSLVYDGKEYIEINTAYENAKKMSKKVNSMRHIQYCLICRATIRKCLDYYWKH